MPQCKMSKFVPAEPRPRRRPTPTQNEAIRRAVVEALNNGYGVRANGAIQWSMIYRTFSAEVRRLVVMDMRRTGFIELPENAHISRLIIYTANPISKERAKTITKYMKFWYKHNKLALARAGARLPVFRRPPASSGAASASSGAASASSGVARAAPQEIQASPATASASPGDDAAPYEYQYTIRVELDEEYRRGEFADYNYYPRFEVTKSTTIGQLRQRFANFYDVNVNRVRFMGHNRDNRTLEQEGIPPADGYESDGQLYVSGEIINPVPVDVVDLTTPPSSQAQVDDDIPEDELPTEPPIDEPSMQDPPPLQEPPQPEEPPQRPRTMRELLRQAAEKRRKQGFHVKPHIKF